MWSVGGECELTRLALAAGGRARAADGARSRKFAGPDAFEGVARPSQPCLRTRSDRTGAPTASMSAQAASPDGAPVTALAGCGRARERSSHATAKRDSSRAGTRATSSARAERELILIAAGTRARRDACGPRAALLARHVRWSSFTETLRSRRLLATLGPHVLELAQDDTAAAFAVEVDRTLEIDRRRGMLLQLAAVRAIAALADAGIRSSVLKGAFLSEWIYGDPGRRSCTDIDLLLAPRDLSAAVEVLRGFGYRAPGDHVGRRGLPLLHFLLEHGGGELPPIELHWRIHWYESSFAEERLLTPQPDRLGRWRAPAAEELVALLLFYARDGFTDLRLASDIAAWWDVRGSELTPEALPRAVAGYPALRRACRVALAVAERTVGVPAGELFGPPGGRLRCRERAAARLANPNPQTSERQLYAEIGLIDGLLAPAGGLRAFVGRQLLPPGEVLTKHAHDSGRRRGWPRLVRCVGMLARFALACTKLARTPEAIG